MKTLQLLPIFVFAVVSSSLANQLSEFLKLKSEAIEAEIPEKPLSKANQSALTYYKNTLFNFEFTAPSGWDFTTGNITEGVAGASITWQGAPGAALWWMSVGGYKSPYHNGFSRIRQQISAQASLSKPS